MMTVREILENASDEIYKDDSIEEAIERTKGKMKELVEEHKAEEKAEAE